MKYKVGDKVKIVDATREEDSIYGFKTGEVVTIRGYCDKNQIYPITNGTINGYINECNLTDLNAYTWEDFEKCPIGTKVTFEDGQQIVKYGENKFEKDGCYRIIGDLEGFTDTNGLHGKIIKIEEPIYTTVYEPTEEVKELKEITLEELKKLIDKMAEDLTTPIHDKEWIINHYLKEIEKDV